MEERRFLALLACADPFKHVLLRERFWEEMSPGLSASPLASRTPPLLADTQLEAELAAADCLPLFAGGEGAPVGVVKTGHSEDESLSAPVLLGESLLQGVRRPGRSRVAEPRGRPQPERRRPGPELLGRSRGRPLPARRRQHGQGPSPSSRDATSVPASTSRTSAPRPFPPWSSAASLVESGVFKNVVVVGGGSLPKLGMKSLYHVGAGHPGAGGRAGGGGRVDRARRRQKPRGEPCRSRPPSHPRPAPAWTSSSGSLFWSRYGS